MVHPEGDRLVAARIVEARPQARAPVSEGARGDAARRRQARGDEIFEGVKPRRKSAAGRAPLITLIRPFGPPSPASGRREGARSSRGAPSSFWRESVVIWAKIGVTIFHREEVVSTCRISRRSGRSEPDSKITFVDLRAWRGVA